MFGRFTESDLEGLGHVSDYASSFLDIRESDGDSCGDVESSFKDPDDPKHAQV